MTSDAITSPPDRKVGWLLGIGIFLLPIVFAWFTLRKGHSTLARVLSLGWLGLMLVVAMTSGPQTPVSPPSASSQSALETSNAAPAADPVGKSPQQEAPPASKWSYREDRDEMRDSVSKYANLTSENEINFGFPYDGGSSANIVVRRRAQDGLQVMLTVSSGQFMCNSFSDTVVNVKFDNGPVQKFGCTDTTSGSSETIFLTNPSRFLAALKKSEKVIVEAQFFQHGPAQFSFASKGLEF